MNELNKFGCVTEILQVSKELGISSRLLPKSIGVSFINRAFGKFSPCKKTGHISIGHDSLSISLELHEFSYSLYLPEEPTYMFFDQQGIDKEKVVVIKEGKEISRIMENSFGMEYFLSNKRNEYLIAVNWYAIEAAGTAKKMLLKLS